MEEPPLRLLSLDGGGVRGYSELLMLRAILQRVQHILHLPKMPLPAECFELIGGTSTGGLIAIILGRLRMSVDEALIAYEQLSKEIFGEKHSRLISEGQSKYSATKFVEIVKGEIRKTLGSDQENATMRTGIDSKCKVFVCTIGTTDLHTIRLLRSYEPTHAREHDCRIWEAAMATCAAPTYFPPIMIGPAHEAFMDAGFGCNNPIVELHREVDRIYRGDRKISCIISLGTGQRQQNQVAEPSMFDRVVPRYLIKPMKRLTVSSDPRAADMEAKYAGINDLYFRFNVEHGLEGVGLADSDKLGLLQSRTLEYLNKPNLSSQLDRAAAHIAGVLSERRSYTVAQISLSMAKFISATERPNKGIPSQQAFYENWLVQERLDAGVFGPQRDYISHRYEEPQGSYSTCSWFLQSQYYSSFLSEAQPRIIWIKGPQGSGKSVLAATIIQSLQNISYESTGKSPLVLYHFCDERYMVSSVELAASLVAQTARWDNQDIFTKMKEFKAKYGLIRNNDPKVQDAIYDLLSSILSLIEQKVYIIVDGIEFCGKVPPPLMALISAMLQPGHSIQPSLLLTTRMDANRMLAGTAIQFLQIQEPRLLLHQLEISPELVEDDIRAYVTGTVNHSLSLSSKAEEERQDIINSICGRSNGMFLYAFLVLEELKEDRIASKGAVTATLNSLPSTILQVYSQNLELARKSLKGSTIIRWVYAATRPLNWLEMQHALAIVDGKYHKEELIDIPCKDFIQLTCGSLVGVIKKDDAQVLQFLNPSVRDFLATQSGPGDRIGIAQSHSMITKVLLSILNSPDVLDFSRDIRDNPGRKIAQYADREDRALFRYALHHWYTHLKHCDNDQDPELATQMVAFLSPSISLRWLVAVMLLPNTPGEEIDSSGFTREIVECLQTWATSPGIDLQAEVIDWSKDFLVLMLDWGHVIKTSPCDVFHIHHDLLPSGNRFRHYLEGDSARSVLQFTEGRLKTSSSRRSTWLQHVFAIDMERGLAYTLEEGFLRCYYTLTGLLASETGLSEDEEQNFGVVIEFTKLKLSPNKRYLALLMDVARLGSIDGKTPATFQNIRDGLQLTSLNTTKNPTAWALENENDLDETYDLADFNDIPGIVTSVVLFELNYDSSIQNNLFGVPSWVALPCLNIYMKNARWKIDDSDILEFSTDSKVLHTSVAKIELSNGERTPSAIDFTDTSRRSSKISEDCSTIFHIKDRKCIEVVNANEGSVLETIEFPGIGHLLAVSNQARFLLILRVQNCPNDKYSTQKKSKSPRREGRVLLYDRTERLWTPLLSLSPSLAAKHNPWKFQDCANRPCFGPEGDKSRVMLGIPAGWGITDNCRTGNQISSVDQMSLQPHLVVFDGDRYVSGFGRRPTLRFLMPEMKSSSLLEERTKVLSWTPDMESAIVAVEGRIQVVSLNQLQSLFPSNLSMDQLSKDSQSPEMHSCSLITTSVRDIFYKIQVISSVPDEKQQSLPGGKAAATLDNLNKHAAFDISLQVFRENDNIPLVLSIPKILSTAFGQQPLKSHYVSISSRDRLCLGPFEIDLRFLEGKLQATNVPAESRIFTRILKSFTVLSHPLEVPLVKIKMSALAEKEGLLRFAIFARENKVLDIDEPLMATSTTAFTAIGAQTAQPTIHVYQFTRVFQEGRVDGKRRREARSFEVFLACFDDRYGKIIWMTHTWSGGSIKDNDSLVPKCAWTIHPSLPLLIWTLPGHKLRVSNIKSSGMPVNLAEPVTFEVDESQALRFSPSGKYLLVQGREAYMNPFWPESRQKYQRTIQVLNLATGMRTSLQFASTIFSVIMPLSFDLDDEHVKVLRLTRSFSIELNLYKLPDLVEMERFELTTLPSDCCCATCGKPLLKTVKVFVLRDDDGEMSIAIGHDQVNIGMAPVATSACEPLILRIVRPPKPIAVSPLDTLVVGRTFGFFPALITDDGKIRKESFSQVSDNRSIDDDEQDPTDGLPDEFSTLGRLPTTTRQMLPQFTDFRDDALDEDILPEDVENRMRRHVKRAMNLLSWYEKGSELKQVMVDIIHNVFADDFPFDTWEDFTEVVKQIDDPEFKMETIMDDLFEEGTSGIGCKIPFFVQTFHFQTHGDLAWTSAADVGWIEEDVGWFYSRMFNDTVEDCRDWYPFPRLSILNDRAQSLAKSDTEQGRRFKGYFGPLFDRDHETQKRHKLSRENTNLVTITPTTSTKLEDDESDDQSSDAERQIETHRQVSYLEILEAADAGDILAKWKNVRKSLSDLSPGLGQCLDLRIQSFLSRSFERHLE